MATPLPGVWGIDLGQCALKAIRLQIIDGEVVATAFDYVEHPKILSQPDADPDELTREALQQFLSRNSLRGDMVIISVPGQSGLARFVKLPPVEEKKIADIVRFEAKQQIPFPLEEVVWDYQKIGSGVVSDGFAMETEIGLFAMKRDMVNRAIQQLKDVNVEVHIVQMAPLALCNYVAYDLLGKDVGGPASGPSEDSGTVSEKKECVVALDIGTDSSNLVITDGDRIIWQRPIPLGGNHFTRVLTKDLKLTFAKAEHLKRNAVKSPDLKKILSSLKSVLNDFVGEVQRSLGYFTNTHRDASIQYMIGLGNAFRLPGLQKYLQEKLQLEVRKLNQLERVKGDQVVSAPTFSENLLSFAVAYGLALQGLEKTRLQTNLLPYEIRVERLVRGKKPWAAAAAAVLLLTVGALAFARSMEKSRVTGPEIEEAKNAVKKVLEKAEALKAKLRTENELIQKSKDAIRKISANPEDRFNWQHLHQYINLSLPRPSGEKLADLTRQNVRPRLQYFAGVGEDEGRAQDAFRRLEAKRFAKNVPADLLKAAEEEEFIKKYLVQVNIEGVLALYSDDLSGYFKNIFTNAPMLPGMDPREGDLVREYNKDEASAKRLKDTLPQAGWVVEIRGFTFHHASQDFVINTIMENLAVPKAPGVNPDLPKHLEDGILRNMSFLLLYKNERVVNPEAGVFKHIEKSNLKSLVRSAMVGQGGVVPVPPPGAAAGKEKKVVDRESWRPIGQITSAAMVDQAAPIGGNPGPVVPVQPGQLVRQPRTEFVILFVWKEPVTP